MGSCLSLLLSHSPALLTQCLTQSALPLSAAGAGPLRLRRLWEPAHPAMAKTAMGKKPHRFRFSRGCCRRWARCSAPPKFGKIKTTLNVFLISFVRENKKKKKKGGWVASRGSFNVRTGDNQIKRLPTGEVGTRAQPNFETAFVILNI